MKPTPATTNFTRMFPRVPLLSPGPETEAGLSELGAAMIDDDETGADPNHTPPAGYTYLGQFIDHDLTLDLTPLRDASAASPEATPNFRNPRLDLDHVYGGGPELSPFLYRRGAPPGEERFLIGMTRPSYHSEMGFMEASANDLPRNNEGMAIVGDPRQDEHLIIAQLHVAFLKLHNRVSGIPKYLSASPHYWRAGSRFEATRRLITWHYQWIVRNDFLKRVSDPEIFTRLGHSRGHVGVGDFAIPVEFSLAAFRFGHSMVRDDYRLNPAHPAIQLSDLFRQTGQGGGAVQGLPADWVIDWRRFFPKLGPMALTGHSRKLDTRIAKGLHSLQPADPPQLPVRTLLRGARVNLPTGQAVAAALSAPALTCEQLKSGRDGEIIGRHGFDTATPLWYYILKEAELLGNGARLGRVGSEIVSRTIEEALGNDPESYVAIDPSWRPTLPAAEGASAFNMSDFVRCAGPAAYP